MATPEGILNLDKPRGLTSHDVVSRVRALTGLRRVGHAGTLDPLATGVLLVCVGRATRVAEYLMGRPKVYRAHVRLGVTTDTYDSAGQIVAQAPVEVGREQVEVALAQFRGWITQTPPIYSALKHQGVSLHRLARRGDDVEEIVQRKARQVEISRLELTAWEPPHGVLEVACSSGTYVRALAHDLGQALGCGAHLTGLTRLASGSFLLTDAVPLERLAQAVDEARWPDLLHPIDAALSHFPALHVDAEAARQLCSGQAVAASSPGILSGGERGEEMARVYGPGALFLALVVRDLSADVWRPHKVFCQPERFG
ncbi:MAG TPA: tRNA pseudouridine(55) synthase TruB [Chloroflexi bacterium]|nr:tRNA pseudouridine(55) synthase TruB [Chloroflexota bacterium]